jgi:hypothetical protein
MLSYLLHLPIELPREDDATYYCSVGDPSRPMEFIRWNDNASLFCWNDDARMWCVSQARPVFFVPLVFPTVITSHCTKYLAVPGLNLLWVLCVMGARRTVIGHHAY